MSLQAIVYTESGTERYDDLDEAKVARGTTWFRADAPTDEEIAAIRETCDLHPLAVEDVQQGTRPKSEEFQHYTLLLVKGARLRSGDTTFEKEIDERPLGLFVGEDWLVTLTDREVDPVERVWRLVLDEDARVLGRGPDFAAYRVLDQVVDHYFHLLDELEDRIEFIEEEVLESTDRELLEELNDARRELLSVRKLLWPTRDAVSVFARGDPPQVHEQTEKYYRDVYDHVVQQVDLVETYRDLAASARDIYLNSLSVSTNEVMKTLTVVATVVLPLTLVVGVFGMNFGDSAFNMPELQWPYAYPAVMLGMALVSVALVYYFQRESWL